MTIADTVVWYIGKLLINPKSKSQEFSSQRDFFLFFFSSLLLGLCEKVSVG